MLPAMNVVSHQCIHVAAPTLRRVDQPARYHDAEFVVQKFQRLCRRVPIPRTFVSTAAKVRGSNPFGRTEERAPDLRTFADQGLFVCVGCAARSTETTCAEAIVLTTALCTIVSLELEIPPAVANVRYLGGGDQPPAPRHRALVSVCARTRHRDLSGIRRQYAAAGTDPAPRGTHCWQ
jgi:hypothetical protein